MLSSGVVLHLSLDSYRFASVLRTYSHNSASLASTGCGHSSHESHSGQNTESQILKETNIIQ